jgi:Bacterial protein of unknown function (DUF899)
MAIREAAGRFDDDFLAAQQHHGPRAPEAMSFAGSRSDLTARSRFGPVPGSCELVVYKHMWYDGAPHQGQCEGCTFNVWHLKETVYLNARGVSFPVLASGRWDGSGWAVEDAGRHELKGISGARRLFRLA